MLFKCKFRGQRFVVRSIATATCIVPLIMSMAKLLDGCNSAFSLSLIHVVQREVSRCGRVRPTVLVLIAQMVQFHDSDTVAFPCRPPFSFFSDSPTLARYTSKNTSRVPIHYIPKFPFRMKNIGYRSTAKYVLRNAGDLRPRS